MFVTMLITIVFIITISLYKAYSTNELNLTISEINKLNNIITSKPTNITTINDTALDSYLSNSIDNSTDNLDLSILDIDTQKKVISVAETKNKMAEAFLNNRRNWQKNNAHHDVPYFFNKTFDLMRQSIYSTRYRLQDTRELRIKYANDVAYKIALMYGSLMQLRLKLDNIYATLKKFPHRYKFIHFLVMYERCVVIHVDVLQMVERMFKISDELRRGMAGETDTEELLEMREQNY